MNNTTHPNSLQLGMIGNCAYSALVDRQARIMWCCLPRFDGDPVFNALLDPSENGSLWQFELEGLERSEQEYEPNTAVCARGCTTRAAGHRDPRLRPPLLEPRRTFRPTTLVRRVKVLQGSPRMRVLLRPRFDWGQVVPQVTQGSTHLRYVAAR